MVKVPSSSTFLNLRRFFKKLPKFTSANLHSLPNRSCHLLLAPQTIVVVQSLSRVRLSATPKITSFRSLSQLSTGLPKGLLMRRRGLEPRNSLRGLAGGWLKVSPTSFVVCLSLNPPRRPSSQALAVNLSETFFPQGGEKKMFQRLRDQDGTAPLARARPETSHLGHPASDWSHTPHRRAPRYRSTGCGRTSPAAGKGKRRSELVRREGGPARGTESHSQTTGWTQRPSQPQARGLPSPWCRRQRPGRLPRPVSLSGDSAELIGSRRPGVPEMSACFAWLLGYEKPQESGDLGKDEFGSVQFCRSVVSDSLRSHGQQHTRPPCPSPTPGVYPNSCPLSWWCYPTNLILCRPLLPPSIIPSIRVFSNESVLHIRWPKYWSFCFSTSHSIEYSGLISFRMDWLDLLAVQGTRKSLLQHRNSKASIRGKLTL